MMTLSSKLAAHMLKFISSSMKPPYVSRKKRGFCYVTPKSFLELIAFYKLLLEAQTLMKQVDRLDIGLSAIEEDCHDVVELELTLSIPWSS